MITEKIKEALRKNWGDKANALSCYAELKFIDPISSWSCYIYAMNPETEYEIKCLVYDRGIEIVDWNWIDLFNAYNREGEYPVIDREFRRIRVDVLYKKLGGR